VNKKQICQGLIAIGLIIVSIGIWLQFIEKMTNSSPVSIAGAVIATIGIFGVDSAKKDNNNL